LLDLPLEWVETQLDDRPDFPLFATREYLSRAERGNPDDPLLRQVLPQRSELHSPPDYAMDPVGDGQSALTPGLLQKYRGRALLVATGGCAIHCRYCFRREYPYQESPPQWSTWNTAIAELTRRESIEEIILSGGDPLTLSDEILSSLVDRLAAIPHLKRLRIHTRLPIVLPQRVNEPMLEWLTGSRLKPIVVIHANHAREFDGFVVGAIDRLREAGIPLLNQSVLLRGINDSVEALEDLSKTLIDTGVIPYYLHLLDRTIGTHEFEVQQNEGKSLVSKLRTRLPGYAVPRLVREVFGGESKEVVL
jgi:EF-P beta-lysylation protein EpmB